MGSDALPADASDDSDEHVAAEAKPSALEKGEATTPGQFNEQTNYVTKRKIITVSGLTFQNS
jgi:hypothetical protein